MGGDSGDSGDSDSSVDACMGQMGCPSPNPHPTTQEPGTPHMKGPPKRPAAGGWRGSRWLARLPCSCLGGTGAESRAGEGMGPMGLAQKELRCGPSLHAPPALRLSRQPAPWRVPSEAAKAWRDCLTWVRCTGSSRPPPSIPYLRPPHSLTRPHSSRLDPVSGQPQCQPLC